MDLTVENAVFDNAYLIVYRPDKLPLLVCMAVMLSLIHISSGCPPI